MKFFSLKRLRLYWIKEKKETRTNETAKLHRCLKLGRISMFKVKY